MNWMRLKAKPSAAAKRPGQGGFPETGKVFDQQMTAGQKRDECGFDRMRITQNLTITGGHGRLEFSADWVSGGLRRAWTSAIPVK